MASKGKHASTKKKTRKPAKQKGQKSLETPEMTKGPVDSVADEEVILPVEEPSAIKQDIVEPSAKEPELPVVEDDEKLDATAVTPAFKFESQEEIATTKAKSKKKVATFFAILVLVVVAIYLAGVAVFSQIYAPNTHISGIDVSFKQPNDLASMLEKDFDTYKVSVKGEGLNFEVDAKNAQVNVNTAEIANYAISSYDAWKWPLSLFESRDLTNVVVENLNEGNLASVVDEKVKASNEHKTKTENAHIQWSESSKKFVVAPEVNGNELDSGHVKSAIVDAIVGLQSSVTINKDSCLKPTIFKDDARFDNALNEANKLATANFNIVMNENTVATVDGNSIKNWVAFEDEFTPKLNSDAVSEWAEQIAAGCNTVGTERTYVRPNGQKSVTVSGGTYGWEADAGDLATKLIDNINNGSSDNIEISATQTANALVEKGKPDWGGRWIDVDLNEQHAYMYIDNQLVWETDVITGNPTIDESTPVGVWKINNKQSPSVLIGAPDANGNPSYRNPVQYWIPFVDNMIGLHDASWRSTFGGNINTISSWSHGCVNLPIAKATEIWDLCVIGDAVIVHY